MNRWEGWHKVRYESELAPHFAAEIASIPGGDHLYSCIQCGTCSGMCPLSHHMDFTPRQIIAMIRAGFKADVLSSYTTWLCASCYSCTVECPKEIKLTDIMYAAKRLAIREGVYPKRFPIAVLADEFFKSVERNGRSSETWLLTRLYLRTNPFKMLKQAGLGMRLWLHGRLGLKPESIERKSELRSILKALEKEHMIKRKENTAPLKEVAS